jgi:HSP90 family molecular chaperone
MVIIFIHLFCFVFVLFVLSENLFDRQSSVYSKAVKIDLVVDRTGKSLTVRDNCRGMNVDSLVRIVQNVGDSQKRGQPFLNGQFGFGGKEKDKLGI